MKKILAVLAVLCCVLSFASCGLFNADNPIDIVNKFEEEGYTCEIIASHNYEDAEELLDEFDVSSNGIKMIFVVYDDIYYGRSDKFMVVFACEDDDAAKDIEEDLVDGLDDKKMVNMAEDYFDIRNSKKYEAGRNGRLVYIGHQDIVEAIK